MLRFIPPLLLTGLCVWLAACGWVGEERAYYMKKEWEQLKGPAWHDAAENLPLPTARQQELANEKAICGHPNSQNRVVTQNGVSDVYTYKRCPLAPYDTKGGSRMGIRPDGNGTVLKN